MAYVSAEARQELLDTIADGLRTGVDLRTGAALTMPATKPTVAHEVRVEGDQVMVRLRDEE